MADDDYAQGAPAGEFPPGLESLTAEIERLASSKRSSQDIRDQVERIAEKAAPFVSEARRALARVHGNTDALSDQIREVLAAVNAQSDVMLSRTSSLTIGWNVYATADVAGASALAANAMVLSDGGAGTDSLEVQKSQSPLDRLSSAYVFYVILIWLMVVGVAVVSDRLNLPPKVVEQLQTDPGLVSLALQLAILFPRRK